jgi:hypothetical protein
MFPDLPRCDPGDAALDALAVAMHSGELSDDNALVPAGYTYLGQFIDHDITFDPLSVLGIDNDVATLADFRTPRLDLDSVYGSGPADQPYLYDWRDARHPGAKLLLGGHRVAHGPPVLDLPRNHQGRALIGDPRNDENLILAQLHQLVLRFHNQVVEHLRGREAPWRSRDLFEEAQRVVRWHYQWIVRHDYLPKVVGHDVPRFRDRVFTWDGDEPYMPVEFSGAAFRFGHSMVREGYVLTGDGDTVPTFPAQGAKGLAAATHLGGFRRLPAALVLEWSQFFAIDGVPADMASMSIDTRIARVLGHLPPDGVALARLNLHRGRALGLPSGQDVVHALGLDPPDGIDLPFEGVQDRAVLAALERETPLWYYVLQEAAVDGIHGTHLGPVGGRIVAEVLTALLEADERSYLHAPAPWRPDLGEQGDFTMGDLVRFTLAGEAAA